MYINRVKKKDPFRSTPIVPTPQNFTSPTHPTDEKYFCVCNLQREFSGMRIRKHAKISPLLYSSSSSFLKQQVPVHVCQLNQSPWDVITFPLEQDEENDNPEINQFLLRPPPPSSSYQVCLKILFFSLFFFSFFQIYRIPGPFRSFNVLSFVLALFVSALWFRVLRGAPIRVPE